MKTNVEISDEEVYEHALPIFLKEFKKTEGVPSVSRGGICITICHNDDIDWKFSTNIPVEGLIREYIKSGVIVPTDDDASEMLSSAKRIVSMLEKHIKSGSSLKKKGTMA